MRIKSTTKTKGQGTTEYTLIGSLLLIISMPVIMMVGNDLNGFLDRLRTTSSAKIAALKKKTHLQNGHDNAALPVDALPAGAATRLRFKNENIPDTPVALGRTIEILGANGASKILADNIEQITKERLAAGAITEAQYKDMIALAEQGHTLARLAKLLEDSAASAKSVNALEDMRLTWNGRTTSFYDLYYNLGFIQPYEMGLLSDPLHSKDYAYGEMKTFLKLFAKVESNGSLNDPALKSLVTNLSQEICWTNDSLMFALEDARQESSVSLDKILANAANRLTSDLVEQTVSNKTHGNSQGICHAGQGKDSGTSCQ